MENYERMSTETHFYKNHLSFAWEHDRNNEFYGHLKMAVENTEILVALEYSFPFFNKVPTN